MSRRRLWPRAAGGVEQLLAEITVAGDCVRLLGHLLPGSGPSSQSVIAGIRLGWERKIHGSVQQLSRRAARPIGQGNRERQCSGHPAPKRTRAAWACSTRVGMVIVGHHGRATQWVLKRAKRNRIEGSTGRIQRTIATRRERFLRYPSMEGGDYLLVDLSCQCVLGSPPGSRECAMLPGGVTGTSVLIS